MSNLLSSLQITFTSHFRPTVAALLLVLTADVVRNDLALSLAPACGLDRPCTKVTFVPTQDEPRDYLDELVELRQKEKSGVMLIIGDNMEVR